MLRQRECLNVQHHLREMKTAQRQAAEHPPIIRRLAHTLHQFELSDNWNALLDAGDIYAKGEFPSWVPNIELAQHLFQVACMCPDSTVAGIAQSKFVESRESALISQDVAGAALPTVYGERIVQIAKERITNTPAYRFRRPLVKRQAVVPVEMPVQTQGGGRLISTTRPTPQPQTIYNDKQNVHDHGVTQSMRKTLHDIRKNGHSVDDPCTVVEEAVLQNESLSDAEKVRALSVLDSMQHNSAYEHSGIGMSEADALGLVWGKIQSMEGQLRTNTSETLMKQLASAIENGHVVCSSGKVARVVGALDGIGDHATPLRPMWAVRNELGTMASQIRGPGEYSEARGEELRREFTNKAKKLYCDELGMKESILNPVIALYANAI